MPNTLTHFDANGQAHMVDVGAKPVTHRIAVASGRIVMHPKTLALIESGTAKKGDVLGIARIAGIMGAKRTSDLIPLCHPLAISHIAVAFEIDTNSAPNEIALQPSSKCKASPELTFISCQARVETLGSTGVEMEALMAVQISLLTIYDMCKAVDRGMHIQNIRVQEKRGGNSGDYITQS